MLNAIKLDLNQKLGLYSSVAPITYCLVHDVLKYPNFLGQFVSDVQTEVAHVIDNTFPACKGIWLYYSISNFG